MNKIGIRAINRQDAQEIGLMIKEFASYLRSIGDNTIFQFNAEKFLQDGFGENRAFDGLIAEVNGKVAGYTLYHDGYDTDKGIRVFYVADLYIRPEYRRQSVGQELFKELNKVARRKGVKKLFWQVHASNRIARKFYWHIGARYRKDLLEMRLPVK